MTERLGPPLVPAFTEDQVSITAVNGKVRWEMTPGRARKVAALLRHSRAFSEAARLDTAATQAEGQP